MSILASSNIDPLPNISAVITSRPRKGERTSRTAKKTLRAYEVTGSPAFPLCLPLGRRKIESAGRQPEVRLSRRLSFNGSSGGREEGAQRSNVKRSDYTSRSRGICQKVSVPDCYLTSVVKYLIVQRGAVEGQETVTEIARRRLVQDLAWLLCEVVVLIYSSRKKTTPYYARARTRFPFSPLSRVDSRFIFGGKKIRSRILRKI